MVDALRGFALLGIILANIPYSHELTEVYTSNRYILGSDYWDTLLKTATAFFIDKKFITVFSMLFGFGFSIQVDRMTEKNTDFRKYFIRRMLWLLLIGCIHGYVLWFGDITRDYAICGLLLVLIYQWPIRRILWVGLLLAIPLTALVFILNAALNLQQYAYDVSIVQELYITESYWRYLTINFTIDPLVNFIQDSPITLVFCSGQILLGFWLGRIGFFATPQLFRNMINKWILLGSTFGITGSIGYWAVTTGKLELDGASVCLIFLIVGGLVLQSLCYIGLFVKAWENRHLKNLLKIFVPVGRMALTNYLLQTIFYLLLFFHWPHGLQLYRKVTITETYLIAIAVYTLQVLYSNWWMKHFTQGPVEMLWRKLAYQGVPVQATKQPY
jgi:uncharacterized protein